MTHWRKNGYIFEYKVWGSDQNGTLDKFIIEAKPESGRGDYFWVDQEWFIRKETNRPATKDSPQISY